MILFEKESYAIMGACFEAYKEMGCGLTEGIYQECLEIEFAHREIPFATQPSFGLTYRGRSLRHHLVPDVICFGTIVVEIKAMSALAAAHRAQILNYLHATNLTLGLLVNFGHHPKLEYERFANTRGRPAPES